MINTSVLQEGIQPRLPDTTGYSHLVWWKFIWGAKKLLVLVPSESLHLWFVWFREEKNIKNDNEVVQQHPVVDWSSLQISIVQCWMERLYPSSSGWSPQICGHDRFASKEDPKCKGRTQDLSRKYSTMQDPQQHVWFSRSANKKEQKEKCPLQKCHVWSCLPSTAVILGKFANLAAWIRVPTPRFSVPARPPRPSCGWNHCPRSGARAEMEASLAPVGHFTQTCLES